MMLRQIKFLAATTVISDRASTSTYLVKYSTATISHLIYEVAFENGPTMSMPQRSKGHAPEIEIWSYGGILLSLL